MIKLEKVSKIYNADGKSNIGIRNINLELHKNEIVAITGDSGCGKSTLLNVIAKIDSFDDGEIYYCGNETSYFSVEDMDEFRKDNVGVIFQNYNILDAYTVLQNVMIPLELKGYSETEAKTKAMELIEKVGLSKVYKHRGSKLSGGEKQRCVIARALASDCNILACDEPTGNLDSKTSKDIINLIKEVSEDKLVLIVTHNFDELKDIATRRIKLSDGEIIEDVSLKEVNNYNEPAIKQEITFQRKGLARNITSNIARKNIFSTPKKLVFTLALLVTFFLLLLLSVQKLTLSNITDAVNGYFNHDKNRLVVYGKDLEPIDFDKLKGINSTAESNSFYQEDNYILSNDEFNEILFSTIYSKPKRPKITYGRPIQSDNEIVLIFGKKSPSRKRAEQFLDMTLSINNLGMDVESDYTNLKVCGISVVDDPSIGDSFYVSDKTTKVLKYVGFSFTIATETDNIEPTMKFGNETKVILPQTFENVEIDIYIKRLYKLDLDNIKLEYDDKLESAIFMINIDTFNPPCFIASVYDDNILSLKQKLSINGYLFDEPSTYISDQIQRFIFNILLFLSMIPLALYGLLAYVVSYAVLSRVYASRSNDYEILRTLGVSKKDMGKVVKKEIIFMSLISIVVAIVIDLIIIIVNKSFIDLLYASKLGYLIYIIIIIFFIHNISKSFNKKLFKFTVSASLRGDEND